METRDQYKQDRTLKITLGIIIVLLLLSLVGMFVFMNRSGNLSDEKELLQADKQQLETDNQRVIAERDASQEEAAEYKREKERLQADHEQKVREMGARINHFRSRAAEVAELKEQIEEFKQMQVDYELLQEQHDGLVEEHEVLRGKFAVLSEQHELLQDSISGARDMKVYNVRHLTKWDRWLWADRYNVNRARRVDQTTITMELDGTPFTQQGERVVYLNMVNPYGEVMYPSQEEFTITETGEPVPYTQKREVDFTGESLPLEFTIDHPERLEAGTYLIEVYLDGSLLRSSMVEFE